MSREEQDTFIGIDLGCSKSCVAVWSNGRAEVVPNQQMNRTTPSCISFSNKGELLIGESALDKQETNTENTITNPLKLLGISSKLQNHLENYKVEVNEHGTKIKVHEHEFCVEQILAILFYNMKENAEQFLGRTVRKAIISSPSHLSFTQKQSLVNAAKIAGFEEVRLISECSAAIINWVLKQKPSGLVNVLSVSLGAGSCAVSAVEYEDGVAEELASNGIEIGGLDLDHKLLEYCSQEFCKLHKKNSAKITPQGIVKLRRACEKAKKSLSAASTTTLHVDSLMDNIDFDLSISRSKFEELNKELFQQILELVDKTLQDAHLERSKIDEIILVGGSSRIPYIQTKLSELFNGKSLCKTVNFDEGVALGCASLLNSTSILYIEKCPKTITASIENVNTKILLKNDSTLFGTKTSFFVQNKNNQKQLIVDMYEGESAFMKANSQLGYYKIEHLPTTGPIDITFNCKGMDITLTSNDNVKITRHFKGLDDGDIEVFNRHLTLLFDRNVQVKKIMEARIEMEERIYSIKSICDYYLEWLDENPNATIDEINLKKLELNSSL